MLLAPPPESYTITPSATATATHNHHNHHHYAGRCHHHGVCSDLRRRSSLALGSSSPETVRITLASDTATIDASNPAAEASDRGSTYQRLRCARARQMVAYQ